ncbi:glucose-6-phosphate isomerase [Legionella maceachernii]|uniref:Glucose-6-phosphate isomerase n=1 Tax=Legionella maceachernii TaxID=466 RepID=A0A0W0WD74_9GAMM|nr:glucose-6-phosphate isomerase [Legionella maceachernii]KTD30163.1 glucose-6-phosphate isomerase [Legionella maceachernii]SJZ93256.1 glucose-6-phosphate isomerase [Legionella maceachernii]SUP03460.1 Glucose-6-phosphate isomerase [Legionella maceachernii]
MKQLTELNSWIALEKHAESLCLFSLNALKKSTNSQNNQFKLHAEGLSVDFTYQRLNEATLELLIALANERQLKDKINGLLNGAIVNPSENRPALHSALRAPGEKPIWVDGNNIMPDIIATREEMGAISQQIRDGKWYGYSGKPITDVVNIGIGGSDFGPRFCLSALKDYVKPDLGFHFVSDADPKAFETAVEKLKPETTLFIISSKSFTTTETLYNAKKALSWINNYPHWDKHFIAVTANVDKAKELGISTVLPIWNWVGGRYSLCSAINLITCIAVGYDHFNELLAGAHSMDEHFSAKALHENIPVIMALVGLWNINFLHSSSLLMLVYAKQLEQLVPYIQQLDMESNGKSIDNHGRSVNHATGPIVWGGLGNQAQHSYYQLLCQGTHKVAADFISTQEFQGDLIDSFCNAKIRVLSEGINPPADPNGYIPGGMPINHIHLESCSPFCLGALIALYEHKIYVQSVLWNINPFDQPGVESAKRQKAIFDSQRHPALV